MNPTVREPSAAYPAPRVLPQHTWSDYARWSGAWELIRGVPYSMSPSPKAAHNRVMLRLIVMLDAELRNHAHLRVASELDWIVDDHTTLRPDVLVAEEPVGDDWLRKPPLLLAEVLSPATAAKDRIEKRAIAEEQRVPWFLLLDPATRTVELWRWSEPGYQSQEVVDGRLSIPLPNASVHLRVSELFP
jgi:Uma2 family endonuclease